MAFTPKDWRNATTHEGGGDTTTPISAAAIEDLETRVTDYTDFKTSISATEPPYNAVGDGATDDAAAIQAALDAAGALVGTAAGAKVYLPKGIYGIASQLTVPNKVQLVGEGCRSSRLLALAGFPVSTAMVRLGEGAGIVFECRLERLGVDCNSKTGSIGVYSNEAQEQSGLFNCTVERFLDIGVDFASGASIVGCQDIEILPTSNANTGIRMTGVAGQSFIRGCSIVPDEGHTLTDGILVNGCHVSVYSIHVERCTDGVSYTNTSFGEISTLYGHSTVTNLVHLDNSANQVTVNSGLVNGGTNGLVDDASGYTATGNIQSWLGKVYWHEVGSAGEPAFENSWVNYAGGAETAAFRREGGLVIIKGRVKTGTIGQTIFTLPAGYRPALPMSLAGYSNSAFCTLAIGSDGKVIIYGGSNVEASVDAVFSPV